MPLPTVIQEQKDLMTDALNKLYLLDHVPSIINKFDPTRAAVIKEELQKDYVEIMSMLAEKLILQAAKTSFEL